MISVTGIGWQLHVFCSIKTIMIVLHVCRNVYVGMTWFEILFYVKTIFDMEHKIKSFRKSTLNNFFIFAFVKNYYRYCHYTLEWHLKMYDFENQ